MLQPKKLIGLIFPLAPNPVHWCANSAKWRVHKSFLSKYRLIKSIKTASNSLVRRFWPGLCVKCFLSFPQKNLSPEKTETKTKCLLFNLLTMKFTVIPKKNHLALGDLSKLVFWLILSLKNREVNTQFSLVTVFFREREKIYHPYSGPADIAEMLTSIAESCYIIYVPWTQIVTNYL